MGGSRNAGLLAVQILALANPALQEKVVSMRQKLVDKTRAKDSALQANLHGKSHE
jgi:5-(carboxyamino)imidazole ribonucleotide mutase